VPRKTPLPAVPERYCESAEALKEIICPRISCISLQEWAANPDNPMDVVLDFDESGD